MSNKDFLQEFLVQFYGGNQYEQHFYQEDYVHIQTSVLDVVLNTSEFGREGFYLYTGLRNDIPVEELAKNFLIYLEKVSIKPKDFIKAMIDVC